METAIKLLTVPPIYLLVITVVRLTNFFGLVHKVNSALHFSAIIFAIESDDVAPGEGALRQ